jgi:DNA repair protein RecN (Recombination protein N)
MLAEITIENLAIIDRVSLVLDRGFNALTGETGAGKSIIIDAVETVLGGRCSPDMVRAGSKRATVGALFEAVPLSVKEKLSAWGYEYQEQLLLSREILANGRSSARIDGHVASVAMIKELARELVDIHGQGEHQLLLDPSRHVFLLDAFAGSEAIALRSKAGELYAGLLEVRHQIAELSDERERVRRIDLLEFQITEIEQAAFRPGEAEELAEERRMLASAQRLIDAAGLAYELIYEGQRNHVAALDAVERARSAASEVLALDKRLNPVVDSLGQATVWLEEAAQELRRYRDAMRPDPERLVTVEDRLSFIAQMKRKYGPSLEEISRFREEALAALDGLKHTEEMASSLRKREQHLLAGLASCAESLSGVRKRAAGELSCLVKDELGGLEMKGTEFQVSIRHHPDDAGIEVSGSKLKVTPLGIDEVEFLLSPNPGEPSRPLSKIASGGEASRIMLAVKSVLARNEGIPTLIFDEIDAGVGGDVGYALGEKLGRIGAFAQVLCVTHLAQIAAFADRHIVVSKSQQAGRTVTSAAAVEGEERLSEIARMIGGSRTRVSLEHASEMLTYATNRKTLAPPG